MMKPFVKRVYSVTLFEFPPVQTGENLMQLMLFIESSPRFDRRSVHAKFQGNRARKMVLAIQSLELLSVEVERCKLLDYLYVQK